MTNAVTGPPFTVERYGSLGESIMGERDWLRREVERLQRQVEFWKQAAAITKGVADSATETMHEVARASLEPSEQPTESGAPRGEAGDRAGPLVSPAAGLGSNPPGSSSLKSPAAQEEPDQCSNYPDCSICGPERT